MSRPGTRYTARPSPHLQTPAPREGAPPGGRLLRCASTGSWRPRNPTRSDPGRGGTRVPGHTGHSGRRGARPGNAKGVPRVVAGWRFLLRGRPSLQPTSRPALRQFPVPEARPRRPPPPPTRYPSRFAAAHLPRAAASGLDRAAQAGGPETLHIHSQSRAAPGSEAGATRTSVNPRRVC